MPPLYSRCLRRVFLALALSILIARASPAADEARKNFDIPAGDAGEALKQFVRQSGGEIMFLSESLVGTSTAAVKGNFTVREALDRLTAGTDLTVTQDGPTGAFAITRKEWLDRIVSLPPYLVTDAANPLRWQYVALPGYEILSCCRAIETEKFIDTIYREQAWLDEIVPPELQARETVPKTLILFDDDIRKTISKTIANLADENDRQIRLRLAEEGVRIRPSPTELMPQIKLWDDDSTSAGLVLKYLDGDNYGSIGFEPEYVFSLLARQVPPLPPWFIEGMLYFYQTRWTARDDRMAGPTPRSTHQNFSPVPWLSPEVTGLLRDDPSVRRVLLPPRELFAGPPPPPETEKDKRAWLEKLGQGAAPETDLDQNLSRSQIRLILTRGAEKDSPWRRDLWASQVLLFVRWAFDDETYERRKALWHFAALAGVQPATEAMFKGCFGMGFDEAGGQLAAYLRKAVNRRLDLIPENPLEFPWIELSDATEAEEARILGDWQRKEFEFVKASHPEYADRYARQADRTFRRAYEQGVRDPDFLAALGIFECTVGDDARARDFLEAAVRAGVARPRAYVELARIRYNEALGKPAGVGGRLDPAQVASVVGLLRAGRAQSPPQFAAYAQAAQAWEHAAAAPTRADLQMLDEGIHFFPGDSGLILATARLKARAGLQ